jgi:isoamylase
MEGVEINAGCACPLGGSEGAAPLVGGGVEGEAALVRLNFAVFTTCSAVALRLYAPRLGGGGGGLHLGPPLVLDLSGARHRTGLVVHAGVLLPRRLAADATGGECGGEVHWLAWDWLCDGRALRDPYARLLTGPVEWGAPLAEPRRALLLLGGDGFDWRGDAPPRVPLVDSVIYELHVRGFSGRAGSGCAAPGTFLGVAERGDHLAALGVTAVELLPVHAFNELEWASRANPVTGAPLRQFWGYSTGSFFAPMPAFATRPAAAGAEFKSMVAALHRRGIEVLLDVVFNHTAELDEGGPCFSFRGLADEVYYMRGAGEPRARGGALLNFTGCGNTLNCNHPVVADLILDCLRYWVAEMHVDGFRFDLASVLCRAADGSGTPLAAPPLLARMAADPVLAGVKLIAEPWDAAGLYQVGSFPCLSLPGGSGGPRDGKWTEWNGKFRDDVRRFLRGEGDGAAGALAVAVVEMV